MNNDTLRNLAQEATPGPWLDMASPPTEVWADVRGPGPVRSYVACSCRVADAAFIAAANPQVVLGLLEIAAQSKRIDVLRAERDELREAPQSLRDVAHMALSGDASGPDVEQQIMCADAALATARSPK